MRPRLIVPATRLEICCSVMYWTVGYVDRSSPSAVGDQRFVPSRYSTSHWMLPVTVTELPVPPVPRIAFRIGSFPSTCGAHVRTSCGCVPLLIMGSKPAGLSGLIAFRGMRNLNVQVFAPVATG